MTTKEQERKALAQIKKIIADLGENSYIATAMDGMIEDAEENIECDFAMSWKNRAEVAEARMSDLQTTYNKQVVELTERIRQKEDDIDTLNAQNENQTKMIEYRDEWLQQKNARIDELNNQLESAAIKVSNALSEVADKNRILADRDFEIMQLKAKLYDMMTKEEN